MGKGKNRNKKVKEEWSKCEQHGKGGFGVFHRQIRNATSYYCALKAIAKSLPPKPGHSRELFAVAILTKGCGLTPEEICHSLLYHKISLLRSKNQLF